MIKVTLLGDSIRLMGYGPYVPSYLGEAFEVFQSESNDRFAKHTFRCMYDYRDDMAGSRIIHWNNGWWDTCDLFGDGAFTSEEDYIKDMTRLADLLLSRYEKVIFATTTPMKGIPNKIFNNERTLRYNELIVPHLEKKGIIINDLYHFVLPNIETYIRDDDKIHLTVEGSKACAQRVAEVIHQVARELDANDGLNDSGSETKFTWY